MENVLTRHSDLQAVFATNDQLALGAVEAVAARKLTGKVLVLLCYKRTISCRIVLWAKRLRQAHRNSALRHILRAWPRPQGMAIVTLR